MKKYLKAVWQFCSYVFVPQSRPKEYNRMKRLDWIVLGVCVLCLYAVIQIRIGCFWYVGNIENAYAINSIIEGLSYSYIAAYLFYILTSFLPAKRRKRMLAPIIRERVQRIGTNNIHSILLEFGRQTGLDYDYRKTEHTVELLKSKDWDTIVPLIKQYNGISITYFRYCVAQSKAIKERVADIIIRYKEVLTEDELVVLEDFSDMSFFSTVESLSSFPYMTVNGGVDSLVEEFVKMQEKYLEMEKVFGIKSQ